MSPPVSSPNFINKTILNASRDIMGFRIAASNKEWDNERNLPSEEQYGGIAQRTFLAGRKLQEEEFKKHGFIKDTSGNYGLVKKAVGNNKYPIWQRTPDEVSREDIIPIGNTYNESYTGIPYSKDLISPGSYPTAYYVDPSTVGFDFETGAPKQPRFYAKSWDLNDYGGKGGSTAGILGKVLDFIGNPVVQTTGYIDITKTRPESVDSMLEDYLYSKGLERHRVDENNLYSAHFFGLPEVTITGKKRRGKKHGYGGHIYDGTTEDSQQMNIPYAGELPDVLIEGKKINNVLRQVKEHWVTNDKGEEVPTYWGYNPTSKQYEQLYKLTGDTDMENSVFSTHDNRHTFNVPKATEMRKAREQWVKNGGNASDFDKVILGYLGLSLTPIALPEIAAGVSSLPIWDAMGAGAETLLAKQGVQNALPWIKSGIASYFAADGLNRFIGPEGAAKTDRMFNTMVNDPNWYNMVNFGKSALGDVLDVSMAGPVVEAATGLKFSTEAAADLLSAAKNTASKTAETVQSTLSNIPSTYYKGKRLLLGNKHQPNIIWRALGLPNRHTGAWRTRNAMENAYQTINAPLRNQEYLLKNLSYLRDNKKLGTYDYAFTYDAGNPIFEPGKYEDISYPISIEMPDRTLLTGITFGKSYVPGKVVTPIKIGQSSQVGFGNAGEVPHLESPSGSAPGIDFLISNDASFQKGLKNYVKNLEEEIDAPVAGSTRLISEDFFGGSPGDTEVYVPEGLFGEVSNKLGFQKARPLRSDTGYAGYSPKGFIGKDGRENVDINIIKDDGTIIHQIESTKNPEHMPKLYDNFARENAKVDTPPAMSASLKIPKEDGSGYYTAEEYFDSIKKDKNVITQNVIDNNFKSSQDKHFKRAFVMMNSDTPKIVKSVSTAIDHMVAQIPGMKRFSDIFKAQKFDNVEENKAILEKIGFKPFDVDKFASNPEQMRNIVDYWYMRKTVGTRGVNYSPSGGVAENSSIDSVMNASRSLDNGSTAGGGGNEVLGNTFGGFTRYYTASNYHAPILDENIATFDDVFNYFKREHDIWTEDTPLVEKTVKDVFTEHKLPLEKLTEAGFGVYNEAKFTNVITNLVRSKKISASEGEEVIDEIAKRLKVTGYRGDDYAGYGDYYGNLRMANRDKKSLSTLRNTDSETHNQPLLPAEWGTDRFFDISKGAENPSYYNVWKQTATDGPDELGALAAERPGFVVDLRQFRNSDGSVSTQKITDAYNEAYAQRTARQRAQAERLNKHRALEEKGARARNAAYKRARKAMAGAGMAGLGFGIYSLVSSGMHNMKEGRILRSHDDELHALFSEYARELKVDPHLWDRESRGIDIDSDTEAALVKAYESAANDILNKYKK